MGYADDVFEGFGITPEDVNCIRNEHAGLGRADKLRISQFLSIQLASMDKHRIMNSFAVTDVIQKLERVGRGCRQKVGAFKHPPLYWFWKAYFFGAGFISQNLINHWGLDYNASKRIDAAFRKVIVEAEKESATLGWHMS